MTVYLLGFDAAERGYTEPPAAVPEVCVCGHGVEDHDGACRVCACCDEYTIYDAAEAYGFELADAAWKERGL